MRLLSCGFIKSLYEKIMIIWWDGIFQDFAALQKSMPAGVASTPFGAVMAKAPIVVFRVVNLLVVGLITLAQVLAIYD